jgi:DNA-binding beta-propeller fold protein YncE
MTRLALRLTALAAALTLTACAMAPTEPMGPPAKEMIYGVTTGNQLVQFNAGQPQKLLSERPLAGLTAGDTLLGIDYRVAKGQLFGLGASGQLYRIDTKTATASAVGTPNGLPVGASEWGVDFNPTVDRIRVVNDAGFNFRLHPDTGAVIDADPATPGLQFDGRLVYDAADVNASKTAAVVAAGYTYNKENDKITTNYALDGRQGTLVHQGSKEGVQPPVSPNTGRLFTVGSLGIGPFEKATLDISDVSNAAYSAITAGGKSSWYRIDLATGKATRIGSVAGAALVGAAIEP